MSEIKIIAKYRETGLMIPTPERIAYRLFVQGIADLTENADLLGAKDENEESDVRLTIKALIEQQRRIPHAKHHANQKDFKRMAIMIKHVLEEQYFPQRNDRPAYEAEIYAWWKENGYWFMSQSTFTRRLREIRAAGGLNSDGNANYWPRREVKLLEV